MTHKWTYEITLIIIVAITAVAAIITVAEVANGSTNFREYASGNVKLTEDIPPPAGAKPANKDVTIYDISMGGRFGIDRKKGFDGNWRIRFSDVSRNDLDNTMFKLEAIDTMEFDNACGRTIYMTGVGKLDNVLGWIIELELSEQVIDGEEVESARVKVWYPGNEWVYDTATDFTEYPACPGHTRIDSGKLDLI